MMMMMMDFFFSLVRVMYFWVVDRQGGVWRDGEGVVIKSMSMGWFILLAPYFQLGE